MANGSTRLALAEVQLKNERAQAEHDELLKMDKTASPKQPLKNPSEHNHSK